MTQVLLISLFFFVSIILLFYTMMKNGYKDIYSIIVFSFILFTWVVPMIFYSNRIEIGIVNSDTASWIFIGAIYFLIQAAVRYAILWLSISLKSRKKTFSYLLLMYAFILFISIFMRNIGSFYLLIIGSSILGATYGLSIKYLMENTGNKACYEVNFLIFSLPIIAIIFGKTFFQMFNPSNTFRMWSLVFASIASVTLIIAIALYFLPDKKNTFANDNSFNKEKIISDFKIKNFFPYFILLAISSFIYLFTITMNVNLLDNTKGFPNDISPIIFSLIAFISFITSLLLLPILIMIMSFINLTFLGISLMFISIFISMLMIIIKYDSWQMLTIIIIIFSIGYVIIHSSIFGDIVHIDMKTSSNILLYCLTIESVFQALGFIFGSGVIFLNVDINITIYILLGISTLLLCFYSLTVLRHKFLLSTLRNKFSQYEFSNFSDKNNNK